MLEVCVCVSVPGCIYGQHMCPQAMFHPTASIESRPPLTSPNVYQNRAARGLQNKKTSIVLRREHKTQCDCVKDTHCALQTDLEI